MKLRNTLAASAIALVSAVSIQAEAATWDFNYTALNGGDPISVTGVLTTSAITPAITYNGASGTGPNVLGFDIASITGTRTEGGITQQIVGLYGSSGTVQWVAPGSNPVSLQPGWYFDNIVYDGSAPSQVDLRGVEYAAISNGVTSLYDVYYDGGTYFENYTPLNGSSVSAVPLPAALPLFGAVVGGLGLFGWRKNRQASAA